VQAENIAFNQKNKKLLNFFLCGEGFKESGPTQFDFAKLHKP
jgi:hypothetical protein